MRTTRLSVVWALALSCAAVCLAQPVPAMRARGSATPTPTLAPATAPTTQPDATKAVDATVGLQIKYVRDSVEYATLTAQIYRVASAAVERARQALPTG